MLANMGESSILLAASILDLVDQRAKGMDVSNVDEPQLGTSSRGWLSQGPRSLGIGTRPTCLIAL